MSVFKQISAVTAMNALSLPARLGTSSVIVVGIAGVVAVVVSVFAMTRGLSQTLVDTGRTDRAIVMRNGAAAEISSSLPVDAVRIIKDSPGVMRLASGRAAASGEMVVAVNLLRNNSSGRAGVTVRGIEAEAATVRPEVRVIEGRAFQPGIREVIVGRRAQQEFRDLSVGQQVRLRDGQWTIVGVFETGGDAHESSLLADASALLSAYERTGPSSVTVLLESDAAFESFKAALTTNPALSVAVERERDYYQRQSEGGGQLLGFVATFVGGIMSLGALLAALNTMYAAVSARAVEIATLRALGFGAGGVVASVLAESLLLALIGALIGAGIASALFNGDTMSMGGTAGSLSFEVRVTPELVGQGVLFACVIGLMGGLLPAVRAARLPVATALRAT